jgi:hypothetical protein
MNRLSEAKASLIASELVKNNYDTVKALIACGYKESYAKRYSGKVSDNVLVKQSLSKYQANIKINSTITVKSLQDELEQLQSIALDKKDLAIVARCIELKGKTIAAFTDSINTNDTTQQKAIDEQAMLEAKRMAEIRLKQG